MDVSALQDEFSRQLRDPNVLGATAVGLLAQAEERTHIKREHIALSFTGLYAVYLIVGYFAELVCNLTGFAYPAYMSFKAIQTTQKDDDTQWLTYWCVFGVFSLLDFFSEPIYSVFPLYWLVKVAFLVWLWHPSTEGAQKLYTKAVLPVMTLIESWLSGRGSRAADVTVQVVPEE